MQVNDIVSFLFKKLIIQGNIKYIDLNLQTINKESTQKTSQHQDCE